MRERYAELTRKKNGKIYRIKSLYDNKLGCGKTTLASKFPKSLILSFEPGTNGLHDKYVAPVKSWSDYKDFVKQLKRTDPKTKKPLLLDKYEILVIDTVDEAYKLCEKYVCNEHDAETIKDVGGYGSGYKILDSEFMDSFRELVYYGYGLLFISHETEKPKINDLGQEYNQIVPALPNRPFLLINKFVDIIGYIRDVPEKQDDKIVHERYIFLRSDERFLTKCRFHYVVPKVKLNYNDFINAIYDAIDKEAAASGDEATDEENIYFSKTFDELMEEAKSIWIKATVDQKESIMTILEKNFGKTIKFSEITAEQKTELEDSLREIKDSLNLD